MNVENAWLELVEFKNSWEKRGLSPGDAFFLFTTMLASMNCRFALANKISLETMQEYTAKISKILYEDLASQEKQPSTVKVGQA